MSAFIQNSMQNFTMLKFRVRATKENWHILNIPVQVYQKLDWFSPYYMNELVYYKKNGSLAKKKTDKKIIG